MLRTDDIRKLSDFRQNATSHLDRLAESGRAEVLTVNGEAKGVVMSPATFDRLMEEVEIARSLRTLDASMADIKAGRTKPAKQALRDIAARLGVDLPA